jgi:hypothetical protein
MIWDEISQFVHKDDFAPNGREYAMAMRHMRASPNDVRTAIVFVWLFVRNHVLKQLKVAMIGSTQFCRRSSIVSVNMVGSSL